MALFLCSPVCPLISVIVPLVSNPQTTNCKSLWFVLSFAKELSKSCKSAKWDEPPSQPIRSFSDGGVGSLNCGSSGLIALGNTKTFLLYFLISSAKRGVVVVT